MLKLTINYMLSTNGQVASLKAGGNGHKSQSAGGEVSVEDFESKLEPLGWELSPNANMISPQGRSSEVDMRWSDTLKDKEIVYSTNQSYLSLNQERFTEKLYDSPQTFEALFADYLAITAKQNETLARITAARKARQDEEARIKQEKEAELAANVNRIIARFLSSPDDRGSDYDNAIYLKDQPGNPPNSTGVYVNPDHPRYAEVKVEVIKRNKADADARDAAEAAREQAKADQIAEWVAEYGTGDQKERLAAGLFPRSEAVDAIKDQAFSAGRELALYERITREDIDHDDECASIWDNDWSMNCDTSNAEMVTSGEWAKLKEVGALFPHAVECSIKRHVCKCESCDGEETRSGIYVKLEVGAFTFNREFAM